METAHALSDSRLPFRVLQLCLALSYSSGPPRPSVAKPIKGQQKDAQSVKRRAVRYTADAKRLSVLSAEQQEQSIAPVARWVAFIA